MVKKQQIPLIVDTSGEPLLRAAHEGGFLLKPNLLELQSMMGRMELDEIDDAARRVLKKGIARFWWFPGEPPEHYLIPIYVNDL